MKPWHWAVVIAGAVIVAIGFAYAIGGSDAGAAALVASGVVAGGAQRFRRQRLSRRRNEEARERAQHAAEATNAQQAPLSMGQAERLRDEAERW